jgi:hypothetical protein
LPIGTPLGVRLLVEGDGIDSETRLSNLPVLVVGESAFDMPIYTLVAEPARGPVGSTHTFSSNIFHPYEPVTLWYHTPASEDVEVTTVEANEEGIISVPFNTAGIAPGSYIMVANGNWSFIQAAGGFIVE